MASTATAATTASDTSSGGGGAAAATALGSKSGGVVSDDLDRILARPSPFGIETGSLKLGEFVAGPENKAIIQDDTRVLVIGAGGLGCEILKDLALSGFRDIEVIDMDTIDLTNLNRQFLFRMKDVGSYKAEVAAAFIEKRVPECKVKAHTKKIQEMGPEFYARFNLVVVGLDNVEARRWLNGMLMQLVKLDADGNIADPGTIVPMIDGGTEGLLGSVSVIIPHVTACLECKIQFYPPQKEGAFQLCTIANTPRKPQHCIAWAFIVKWPQVYPNRKYDTDSAEDMRWLYEQALERAKEFNISGVTYMLTMGVVKNIIPAVASSNAIISAACCNEAVKLVSFAGRIMDNFMQYAGDEAANSSLLHIEKHEGCVVCSRKTANWTVPSTMTLQGLIDRLKSVLTLKDPFIMSNKPLYYPKPESLEEKLRPNLKKAMSELVTEGQMLAVTDPIFPTGITMNLSLHWEGAAAAGATTTVGGAGAGAGAGATAAVADTA